MKNDHEEKQRQGIMGIELRFSNDSSLGKHSAKMIDAHKRGDIDEFRKLYKEHEGHIQAKMKRLPAVRHKMRLKSMYADLDTDNNWSIENIDKMEAYYYVNEACNSYALIHSYFNLNAKANLSIFLKRMAEIGAVKFPRPKWPLFPIKN